LDSEEGGSEGSGRSERPDPSFCFLTLDKARDSVLEETVEVRRSNPPHDSHGI
jgi:hypothetical protein